MAKAFLSLLIGKLESMAGEKAGQELQRSVGVQTEAEKLRSTLQFIKAVSQDAEVKQMHQKGVKVWMEKLKDIMYDADDVLDDWFTRVSIPQSEFTRGPDSGISIKVYSYLSSHSFFFQPVFFCLFGDNFQQPVHVHCDTAHKIKDIRDRLDALTHEKDQLNLNLITDQTEEDKCHFRWTNSMVDMSEICGRDFERETIVSMLQGESSTQQEYHVHVPVISIVGMGGLGKTTLAQIIYNDDTTKGNFELCMWVSVSEPFDHQRVSEEIMEQARPIAHNDGAGSGTLHQRLQDCVQGKRFLLVLDDVWFEDPKDWTPLKLSLDAGLQGSRIIVTTRSEQVANMMNSTYTHKLRQLSEDDSCSLFRKIAFSGASQEKHQRFEEIGDDIAVKCKGVPLALKTIASLMRLKRTKQDWRNVLVNGIWDAQLVENNMLPALLLSYNALPSYLKQCFTYCAIFPKGSEIIKNELVQLWMAQGYLGLDEEKELEMIGTEFFEDLAMRSFFQDFKVDDNGNVVSCKMHDLVHDLVHFLTETECSVLESNGTVLSSNHFRHINAYKAEIPLILKAKNLRSLIIRPFEPALEELCSELKYLRVLSLDKALLKGLIDEVGRLLHLRYLDLSRNYELKELPETICNLTNLQTLKLNHCSSLCKLPKGMGELSKIRHLEIEETENLCYFPRGIGNLRRLRTLCKFIVSGGSERCTVGELGSLNHLEGTLQLTGLRKVRNVEEANQAKMQKKRNLSGLWLSFGDNGDGDEDDDDYRDGREEDIRRMEGVLKGLQPNANLQGLVIYGYLGFTFPFWMSRKLSLSNVVVLALLYCMNCIQLPALGSLESLERLVIKDFKTVRHIGHEFYGIGVETSFPKLKKLTLHRMTQWEDWEIPFSNFKKVMPRLCDLKVKDCQKLMRLPALGRLESLETITLKGLDAVKIVGAEFISGGGSDYEQHQQEEAVFPRLKELAFHNMPEWEKWDLPISLFHQEMPITEFMPQLSALDIVWCPKLKAVPAALGKLKSLEHLKLENLDSVRHLSDDILGISDGSAAVVAENGGSTTSTSSANVLFPRLAVLRVGGISGWEEDQDNGIINTIGTSTVATTSFVMPGLKELWLGSLSKLKVMPHRMLSHSLRRLHIYNCPALMGSQPCLPSLLEHLDISGDAGIVSKSLIPIISRDNIYPNLKSLQISNSPHSSLPEGLSKFTSLQLLQIYQCRYLDLEPEEELRHFPMLQELEIDDSHILRERCIRDDWWNKLCHQISYSIVVDREEITITQGH